MMLVMPIVGRLYNKVSPRATVAFGIVLFAYTAWLMGHYTLATGQHDIVHVLIIQGVAFSCLFIPLTTMALSTIPRHRLPDATGLNSLLRQTGGSVGLAIFATLLGRWATHARESMLPSVTMMRPEVVERVRGMTRMFMGRGMDAAAAQGAAVRMLDAQVRRQAMVLSFEKLFYLSGILFLCVLPLVFLLRAPKNAEAVEVHMEM
jgi:DHA2 family multidrug resistance protein